MRVTRTIKILVYNISFILTCEEYITYPDHDNLPRLEYQIVTRRPRKIACNLSGASHLIGYPVGIPATNLLWPKLNAAYSDTILPWTARTTSHRGIVGQANGGIAWAELISTNVTSASSDAIF